MAPKTESPKKTPPQKKKKLPKKVPPTQLAKNTKQPKNMQKQQKKKKTTVKKTQQPKNLLKPQKKTKTTVKKTQQPKNLLKPQKKTKTTVKKTQQPKNVLKPQKKTKTTVKKTQGPKTTPKRVTGKKKTNPATKKKSVTTALVPTRKPGKNTKSEKKNGKGPSKVIHDLTKTYFCVLRDYGSYANVSKDLVKVYPWVARVVHSKTKDFPHKCTASCIGVRLFVTAARCLTILVVEYTRVKYAKVSMPVLAFVVPSKPTKQMFDDIGIIVVEATSYKGSWPRISLMNMNRTDDDYQWLDKLQLEKAKIGTHVVVGYAKEELKPSDTVYKEFKLSSLVINVGMSLCYKIMQERKEESSDFWVPCYHSCTVKQQQKNDKKCFEYLGALGAAVIDTKTKTLIGVATWGTRLLKVIPPVGFAIPNSKNFFEDLACAKKVLKDNGATADMQSLCTAKKKPK